MFESETVLAASPSAGELLTGPSPVMYIEMYSPACTGRLSHPLMLPVGAASVVVPAMRIAPCPLPVCVMVKIPGAVGCRGTDCGGQVTPLVVTCAETLLRPANSQGNWNPICPGVT